MDFQILWPDRRRVSAAQINTWYDDAVANGEIEALSGDATDRDRALALDDAGLVTLQSPSKGTERS